MKKKEIRNNVSAKAELWIYKLNGIIKPAKFISDLLEKRKTQSIITFK